MTLSKVVPIHIDENALGLNTIIKYNISTPYFNLFVRGIESQDSLDGIFGCEFLGLGLFDLGDLGRRFVAQSGSAPMLLDLVGTLIEVGLHSLDELIERAAVTRFNLKMKRAFYEVDFRAKEGTIWGENQRHQF